MVRPFLSSVQEPRTKLAVRAWRLLRSKTRSVRGSLPAVRLFERLDPILKRLFVLGDHLRRADEPDKVGAFRAFKDDAKHSLIGPELLLRPRVGPFLEAIR